MLLDLHRTTRTTLRYRWLAMELLSHDLKVRYRGTILGFMWALLNPLLFMAIYTLVFSVYLHIRIPNYPLYLLCGMIPYTWLANAVQQGISAIPDGRMYVGKTLFPTELLILAPILVNGVNFIISLVLIALFALVMGVHLGWSLLLLPVVVAIEFLLIAGTTLLAATFNVFYRDLQQLVAYAMSALFFITPIFYQRESVPAKWHFLITFNPLAAIISMFQSILYSGSMPSFKELGFAAAVAVVLVAVAAACFQRYRDFFGEYV